MLRLVNTLEQAQEEVKVGTERERFEVSEIKLLAVLVVANFTPLIKEETSRELPAVHETLRSSTISLQLHDSLWRNRGEVEREQEPSLSAEGREKTPELIGRAFTVAYRGEKVK